MTLMHKSTFNQSCQSW